MNARDLIDKTRNKFIDMSNAPTRNITYTFALDGSSISLNSFVGGGKYNEDEKDIIADYQSFGGLKLANSPKVGDTILHDSDIFKVQRYIKFNSTYQAFCRISRHSGKPKV